MIIGITGRAGSGKTYAQQLLAPFVEDCLDLDVVGHHLFLQDEIKAGIQDRFGSDVIVDGEISREKLRKIVFNLQAQQQTKLQILNEYLHPIIKSEVDKWVKNIQVGAIVGALIHHIHVDTLCHMIINIDATDEDILRKSPDRKEIIACQESRDWYQSHADMTVMNTWDSEFDAQFLSQIKMILQI